MAMCYLRLFVFIQPLHDSSVFPYRCRHKLISFSSQLLNKYAIQSQDLSSLHRISKKFTYQLIVHRGAGRNSYNTSIAHPEIILGRGGRSRNQIPIPWIFNQHIHKEQRGSPQYRIHFRQVFFIHRIEIMMVQMLTKPCGGCIRCTPRRMFSRSGKFPQIS